MTELNSTISSFTFIDVVAICHTVGCENAEIRIKTEMVVNGQVICGACMEKINDIENFQA